MASISKTCDTEAASAALLRFRSELGMATGTRVTPTPQTRSLLGDTLLGQRSHLPIAGLGSVDASIAYRQQPQGMSLQAVAATTASPASYFSALNYLSQMPPSSPHLVENLINTNTNSGRQRDASLVRKEEVEAALKSKPQRGRKRANLNEMERLELTRTRNREHAKSTRVRKKARYEELLDCERRLQERSETEKLIEGRRQTVLDFVSLRERMLRSYRSTDLSIESDETVAVTNAADDKVEVHDVVANIGTFSFVGGNSKESEKDSASVRMKKFDETLGQRAVSCFGGSVLQLLSYKVKGSRDGVSLNLCNSGFAEVELVLSSHRETCLMSAILQVQFEAGSQKLSSAIWRTIKYNWDGSKSRLESQISHPSVVSLDHLKPTGEAMDDGTDQGPGMNI